MQDQVAYLEHLLSILIEFDANNALLKDQFGLNFYEKLRALIKLWIAEVKQQWLFLNNFITAVNKIKVKPRIYNNQYLNNCCFQRKQFFKLVFEKSQDQQSTKKFQLKAKISGLTISLAKPIKAFQQGFKAAKKAQKKKKNNY